MPTLRHTPNQKSSWFMQYLPSFVVWQWGAWTPAVVRLQVLFHVHGMSSIQHTKKNKPFFFVLHCETMECIARKYRGVKTGWMEENKEIRGLKRYERFTRGARTLLVFGGCLCCRCLHCMCTFSARCITSTGAGAGSGGILGLAARATRDGDSGSQCRGHVFLPRPSSLRCRAHRRHNRSSIYRRRAVAVIHSPARIVRRCRFLRRRCSGSRRDTSCCTRRCTCSSGSGSWSGLHFAGCFVVEGARPRSELAFT